MGETKTKPAGKVHQDRRVKWAKGEGGPRRAACSLKQKGLEGPFLWEAGPPGSEGDEGSSWQWEQQVQRLV